MFDLEEFLVKSLRGLHQVTEIRIIKLKLVFLIISLFVDLKNNFPENTFIFFYFVLVYMNNKSVNIIINFVIVNSICIQIHLF